ncbi:putative HTH-type transcriptional regulator YxaF [Streptomyces sp. RB5]|uniref:Putative HTH-type transcriptional regulator YxaF n=1 Tax=Streptomyces smaragdinus TaxID=2585196 RepID=A0A7K0CE15_9ACTN|nr:TetR/AcrR family transcriptional regulator [Streptomyces smaragdinus]MQY11701.1 putative HTH-type transcriptional regulator YxaF [Streptomyces smaragdinus]
MSTADRLIDATSELLWERGYTGTSPKAIQRLAGAGQGSMYHHFAGKQDLALAAIRRTAEQMRSAAEADLAGPGTAVERIERYLLRERDALRGCPVGRLTQDPDIVASAELRAPVDELFDWLRARLTSVVEQGRAAGEFEASLDPAAVGAAVAAAVQGGYVLARAAGSAEPFEQAVRGAVSLIRAARS